MNRLVSAVLASGLCLCVGCARPERQEPVVLTAENVVLVIAADASPAVRFAAGEMKAFLGATFGTDVPISHRIEPGKFPIVLGDNEWSRAEGLSVDGLETDAFRSRVTADRIFLLGTDDPKRTPVRDGYDMDRSTSGACYDFLERYADTRFFFPGELGTCVTRKDRIVVPLGDAVRRPVFTERYYREWFHMGPWYEKGVSPKDAHALNKIRLRYGSRRIPCCHGQRRFHYTERFAATHPEYFAQRKDGTRRTEPCVKLTTKNYKFCYSSGIKDEMYLDAKAYLTGQPPETRGLKAWEKNCAFGRYVDLMPEDDYVECWCDACQKNYDKTQRMYASEFIWGYTADIARRLQDEGIKGDITMMAYAPYRSVPKVELPSNVQVMVAEHGPWSANDAVAFEAQKREVRAWAEKLGHKVWLWTYPGKFCGGNDDAPQISPRAYAKYFRETAPWIFGGYAETQTKRFAYDVLNVYVFAKLGWDPDLDIEALLDDFHAYMFGAAAAPMKRAFDRFEDLWMNGVCGLPVTDTPLGPVQPDASPVFLWGSVYTDQTVAALEKLFDEARAAVPEGSVEARRIAWFRAELVDPLKAHSGEFSVEAELARRKDRKIRNVFPEGMMEALDGWRNDVVGAKLALDRSEKVTGAASIRITAPEPPDMSKYVSAQARHPLKLEKGKRYRLSYFLKVKDVKPFQFESAAGQCQGGAGLVLWEGKDGKLFSKFPRVPLPAGTFDWAHLAFEFVARDETASLDFRLVQATGTMWVDDLLIEKLDADTPELRFSVSVTHPDGVYAAGEVVPMTVTVTDTNGAPVSAGSVTAVLNNYGRKEFARRTVDLSKENPFVVKATRPTPGAVRLTLSAAGTKPASWGVMFSPERIRTGSLKPSDFDAFWREAKARYDREVPVDVKLERLDGFCTAARTVSRLSLTTPHGRTVDGVLTEPADLSAGPFPVRINVPGAGPSYGLSWGGGKDRIGLVMNVHYYPLVPGQHEHSQSNAELRALWKAETDEYRRKYGARIYWLAGAAASREDFHYYDCILAISRAIDWLWTRPEAKKDDFRYSGVSQGGGMGLILSGFNTHITRTAVYVPALTDMLGFLDEKRQSGWPQIAENHPSEQRDAILANIPYFDAAHFASRIRTPIRIAVGLSDPACPPAAVWAGFNAIPADDKGIVPGFGMTHSPYPEIRKELDVWLNE